VKALLYPFVLLSAVGLVLSLIVHTASLLGQPNPLGSAAWGLHIGIFIVWLPAVLVAQRHTRDFKQKDFWKAALRGCPKWMRGMTVAFFVYALVNFAIFFTSSLDQGSSDPAQEAAVFRGFSGHWMAFYSAALAILYSATRIHAVDPKRRCVQGHTVGPLAKYCEECGSPVLENPTPSSDAA